MDTDAGLQEALKDQTVEGGGIEPCGIVAALEEAPVGRKRHGDIWRFGLEGFQVEGCTVQGIEKQGAAAEPIGKRSLMEGATVFDDHEEIAESFEFGEHMGTNDEGCAAFPGGEEFAGRGGFAGVEAVEGFVEQYEGGVSEEGLSDHHAAAHAVGEGTDGGVEPIVQMNCLDRVADGGVHLMLGHVLQEGIETEQFPDGGFRGELGILREEGNFTGVAIGIEGSVFQHIELAVVRGQETGSEG